MFTFDMIDTYGCCDRNGNGYGGGSTGFTGRASSSADGAGLGGAADGNGGGQDFEAMCGGAASEIRMSPLGAMLCPTIRK